MLNVPSSGKWLPLREAVSLAMYGFAWDGRMATFGNEVITGLLKGVVRNDHAAEKSIWAEFERALNRAAFAGEVQFYRLEDGVLVKIDQGYFLRDRGFSLLSNEVSSVSTYGGMAGLTDDESHHSYRDVVVERATYMTWLNESFPGFGCVDGAASSWSHWPIAVALAWVWTRDQSFIEEQFLSNVGSHEGKSILDIVARYASWGNSSKPKITSLPEIGSAWAQLRNALLGGRIVARESVTAENLKDDPDGLSVWVEVNSLLAAFPSAVPAPTDRATEFPARQPLSSSPVVVRQPVSIKSTAAKPGREPLGGAICSAAEKAFPNGRPEGMSLKVYRDEIRTHLPRGVNACDKTFGKYGH